MLPCCAVLLPCCGVLLQVVKAKQARAKKPVDTDAPEVRPDVVKPGSKDKDVSTITTTNY
jgi:hypothetical protein